MTSKCHMKLCFVFIVSFTYITGLQVIPERITVNQINHKYVDGKAYVNRYGRNSGYYFNIEGITKQTWNNNVSLHLIFQEFLHNEYRRTFVEMHFKFCDMLKKDPYIGGMLVLRGLRCPMPPQYFELVNLTIPSENFDMVWPFEKGRVDVEAAITDSKETIFNFSLFAIFKKEKVKKSKSKKEKV